jgi:hypothetical protein
MGSQRGHSTLDHLRPVSIFNYVSLHRPFAFLLTAHPFSAPALATAFAGISERWPRATARRTIQRVTNTSRWTSMFLYSIFLRHKDTDLPPCPMLLSKVPSGSNGETIWEFMPTCSRPFKVRSLIHPICPRCSSFFIYRGSASLGIPAPHAIRSSLPNRPQFTSPALPTPPDRKRW